MVLRCILPICLAAAGAASAQDLPVHVDLACAGATLAMTLQDESGTLYFSGAEMPMARARTASGVKFDSVDDPETHVWTRGDEAMIRIAGQDLQECRVERVARVTEGSWTLSALDGQAAEAGGRELTFAEDGSFSGKLGCGAFDGSWVFEEGMLQIDAHATDGEACAAGAGAQDEALLAALGAVTGLGFSPDGHLELRAGDVTRISATH